ncbi:MAG: LysR family transcriptional regulator [Flavobacteriia bacterium]|jgi:DNA-binding transcriptional LysR family regulator
MNYTLNQLTIFLKIVECKSITKAAEMLHLTQPAVSIQLKNFQDQFDIPLTQVVNRKLYITSFGLEIASAAQKIIHEVNEINYKTASFKGRISGQLTISVVSTGKYVIPIFLTEFLQKHPDIELQLDVSNKSKIITDIQSNATDFSLVSVVPKNLLIESIPLMKNQLFLVGSKSLLLDKIDSINDIPSEIPFIYREEGSATRAAMEEFIQKNNISVKKKLVLTSNEAVKQAVIAKLGISIMPLIGIRNEIALGQLNIIPVKNLPIVSEWNIIWSKGKRMFPAAKAFLEYLKLEKDRITAENFSLSEI